MQNLIESRWTWFAVYIGAYSYAAPDPHEHWGFAALSLFAGSLVAQFAYDPAHAFDQPETAGQWLMVMLVLLPWGFGLYNHENLNLFRAGAWAAMTVAVVQLIGFIWSLIAGHSYAQTRSARGKDFMTLGQVFILGPFIGLFGAAVIFAVIFFAIWVADLFGIDWRFEPPVILFVAAPVVGLAGGFVVFLRNR